MKWLGHKQHYLLSDDCHFSMATLLDNGYLVSTIGDYYNRSTKQFEKINSESYFETLVFKTSGETMLCGCPKIEDRIEVDSKRYDHAYDAEKGHMDIIEKWNKK
jgi:hypothetical protein